MKKALSIRQKILLIFVGVVVFIALAYFLMNTVFWNGLYMRENEHAMTETYHKLETLVKSGKTSEADFRNVLNDVRTGLEIRFCLQGDSDWEFTVITRQMISAEEAEFLRGRLQRNLLRHGDDTNETVRILEQTSYYTLQEVTIKETGNSYLECFGYMEDGTAHMKHFILSMPLQTFLRTKEFSESFFITLTILVLLLAVILIIWITYRITNPIYKLTDISKRMRDLDFSARYTGTSRDEIGELGNNMNELSSQLERTIRELRMANEKLAKDLKEKDKIDAMRKDFLSNVSHELKTPIALIQGYGEGLKELDKDSESFSYYCDVIIDEANKMNRMVQKLTTLNQLEFGNSDLTMEPFDLMEMVRGVTGSYAKEAREKGIDLQAEGPETSMVIGDGFSIEEVLKNYLSNAFHYVSGEKKIKVSFDDLSTKVRITVSNTGDPIPEDELEKIWIKFYKVDKARTRSYGGSGIGLSIVKAIMDAHKEECGVYNAPGEVRFWFELKKAEDRK